MLLFGCQDEVQVNVVQLGGIRIFAPLNLIQTSTQVPKCVYVINDTRMYQVTYIVM